MTTRQQIKQLTAPLLERNPDLVLVRDFVVLRPVEHLLRFILIDRTGNPDVCDPRWGSAILFCKLPHFPIGGSYYLRRKGPDRLWRWSDPTMAGEFAKIVETEILPQLRIMRTLQDYLDLKLSHRIEDNDRQWGIIIESNLAIGNLDRVKTMLKDPRGARYIEALNDLSNGLGARLFELGGKLGTEDRLQLAHDLHNTEEATVRMLGLRDVWKSAAFPLEQNR